MLHILWALINVGLSVYFIFICVKATKHIKQKVGLIAAIVFLVFLFSFMKNLNEDNNNEVRKSIFSDSSEITSGKTSYANLILEKTSISQYELHLIYGKKVGSEIITPIHADSGMNGWVLGVVWRPLEISVDPELKNKLKYSVNGVVEWKLLGLTVYSQPKFYKGYVETSKSTTFLPSALSPLRKPISGKLIAIQMQQTNH